MSVREQVVDVPVPQCQEDIVEVMIDIPQARISELFLGPFTEEIVKVVQIMDVDTEE